MELTGGTHASGHAYALTTEWMLDAPIVRVWESLMAPEQWPRWWRYVESVELLRRGDVQGVGAIRRYVWSSRLPYRLTFDMKTTAVTEPTLIEGEASGELDGVGRWRLSSTPRGTSAQYEWRVTTARRWMNALAPLLAPVFAWNHDQVMAEGGRGLARHLGVRLLAYAGSDAGSRARSGA